MLEVAKVKLPEWNIQFILARQNSFFHKTMHEIYPNKNIFVSHLEKK
jgi:hypothetical protein